MRALVTGGQGFLGLHLVRFLLGRGVAVRALVRRPAPEVEALGVECVVGDLRDPVAVRAACRDRDVVFHVAAHVALWGPWEDFFSVNVRGTENVLAGCRAEGVPRLVYTSTPSVVFDNSNQEGINESLPYPDVFLSPYPASKALAEKAVLAAHGRDGLCTVALRPHLIWGPDDPHIVGQLLKRARRGRLFLVGSGRNRVDVTYVDNCAEAHWQAAQALGPGSRLGGRAYFLSQGHPVPIAEFMRRVADAAGLSPRLFRIPYPVAWAAGWLMEKFGGGESGVPLLTRFLAAELAKSHYYDIAAARTDFGYEPRITTDEGFRRLAASLASKSEGTTR
ncbi:MAG TPA: NAD-dependent epimerase/dehydratase family protein [Elusimicrobiota bacterium]|nr:NAD-dependent epimerase/dehydratase family protein [Elusimicrobiota bacterium]